MLDFYIPSSSPSGQSPSLLQTNSQGKHICSASSSKPSSACFLQGNSWRQLLLFSMVLLGHVLGCSSKLLGQSAFPSHVQRSGIHCLGAIHILRKHIFMYFWHPPPFIIINNVQVNLCQKLSFLNQLNHNMTRDCSLNSKKNTSSQHVVYKNCFFVFVLTFKTIFVHNMLWTCIFRGIQWTLSSYCGLTDSRMRASDTDLPVQVTSFYDTSFSIIFIIRTWFNLIYLQLP